MRTILTQLLIDEYMDLMTLKNMEAIMFSILRLEIVFSNTRSLENWGIINNYSMSARWRWDGKYTGHVGYNQSHIQHARME